MRWHVGVRFRHLLRIVNDPKFPLLFLCVLCASAWNSSLVRAQDWPQWRGPNRDGVATGFKLPAEWPKGELKPAWKIPLGDGYSAPVIVGGKLFTHDREGDDEFVYCFDAATGKQIWRFGYTAPYKMHDAAIGHGLGPKATTTVVDDRVYAFGISSILTCLDADSGKPAWQHDLKVEYTAEPAEYGSSGSPLIDGSLVIVPVGGKLGGSVMAFDKKDGKFVWKAVPGEMPAMNSPIVADLAGVRHVLTFTEKQFVGLDARTGKVLWSYPFTTSYRQNIVTPVVVGDLVIASGIGKYTFALRVTKSGNGVKMSEAWTNRDFNMYMTSPVVADGHLYGIGRGGVMHCVNVATGKTVWSGGNLPGDYWSIVVAGDRLLVLDTDGQLTVIKADPSGYKVLGESKVSDGQAWSHLALVGSRIFVRDRERLACFDLLP
jgi:outer membrane protein assembly factor BamB